MKIVVPAKLIPDLVDELTIDASGTALDSTWLRLIINEFDDHAIEQAIILKERGEGYVTIVSPNVEGVEDLLFTAAAKGADQLIKVNGIFDAGLSNHALARGLVPLIQTLTPDLILVGVQAHNDMDGSLGALLAEYLNMPYVGYVSGVSTSTNQALVRKEYPGGLIAEMAVTLPAVLGIQSAEQPPRYVAISKVRQMMKTASIEEYELASLESRGSVPVSRMFQPEASEKATMLPVDVEETSTKLVEIFKELGAI